MDGFLDYRDRYYELKLFRRTDALEEEKELLKELARKGQIKGLSSKLAEYKNWWSQKIKS